MTLCWKIYLRPYGEAIPLSSIGVWMNIDMFSVWKPRYPYVVMLRHITHARAQRLQNSASPIASLI